MRERERETAREREGKSVEERKSKLQRGRVHGGEQGSDGGRECVCVGKRR